MKSFTESAKPSRLAQELATLDSETIARIFLSVLTTRKDSAILKGIDKTLQTRLDLINTKPSDAHPEMF